MRRLAALIASVVFSFACTYRSPAAVAASPAALAGGWAGEHVTLTIERTDGTLQFDCAHAVMTALAVDAEGNFSATGTFSREHGGPIRQGEQSPSQTVRFRGHTDGKSMALTIISAEDPSTVIGEFALEKGSEGRLFRCY